MASGKKWLVVHHEIYYHLRIANASDFGRGLWKRSQSRVQHVRTVKGKPWPSREFIHGARTALREKSIRCVRPDVKRSCRVEASP